MSDFPSIVASEAFSTAALSNTPSFTTLARVRSLTLTRGRSSELSRPSAGVARLVVDARNRDMDPSNAAGPYYPNVVPNRRVKVVATPFSGTPYTVFEGFADAHNVGYSGPRDAWCALPASDGFKVLARAPLMGMATRPEESTSARVTAILDFVGWPAGRRSISTGSVRMVGEDISNRSALEALMQTDETENGRVFVSRAGNLTMLSRQDIETATRQTTPQAVFSDVGGSTVPYRSIELENSETLLRNSITVAHPTFDQINLQDATSIAAHGPIDFARTVRDTSSGGMVATAEHLLALYKNPLSRVLGLTVKTSRPTSTFPHGLYDTVLPLEYGDRVTVTRTPPGGGAAITGDYFIEQITHTPNVQKQSWETVFGLSFAGTSQVYGLWDSATWDNGKWAY